MFNLKKAIIPCPKEIKDSGDKIKITSFMGSMPSVITASDEAPAEEGANLIIQKLSSLTALVSGDCNEYTITLSVDPEDEHFTSAKPESYFIDTTQSGALLCGIDAAGVFYAAATFCQMIFEVGEDVYLPEAFIFDYPDFSYRGQFMECRYGSEFMTKEDWLDVIDYMAAMKSNQLTIGVYGCWTVQYDNRDMQYLYVPITKYPKLNTPKNIKYYSVDQRRWIHEDNILPTMFEQDFFGELIAYGKRKNVTVKPLFNSLGHNTLIPRAFPEISAKNEKGESSGFGFCTNNDKTYEVMFSIYDEIIEKYLAPNGITDIEIGLDEVGKEYICHCEKCEGKAHSELMVEYIIKLCKYLKSKGMKRIYIYHDMLYHEFDIINEELKQRFVSEEIYDEVVIDWWSYEDPKHLFLDNAEGVNNIFHSVMKPDTGYYHWAIPTENNENIRACTKMAKNLGFEGVESYSSFEHCYDKNYLTLADVTWNTDNVDDPDEFDERYAAGNYPDSISKVVEAFKAMSDIMKDETGERFMNRACSGFEYYFHSYISSAKPYPRNFPGDVYKMIENDEVNYVSYLKYLKEKSAVAKDFFENSGASSHINTIWQINAGHYYALADEYLTLYGLWQSYNKSLADEYEVIHQLDRLIAQREKLMLLAERTRIPATAYTYLRNMSIFRQIMTDLRDYFKCETAAGRKPKLDMTDLRYVTGKKLEFLQ